VFLGPFSGVAGASVWRAGLVDPAKCAVTPFPKPPGLWRVTRGVAPPPPTTTDPRTNYTHHTKKKTTPNNRKKKYKKNPKN
ncbi:hypothetical protein ACQWHR_25230, partial [Salmonella enterica subsp. enterica serovar Infantis]